MTENIISFIGAFLKHVVGVLMLCWRRMLRAGLIAFAIGVTLTLLVAVITTGQAFPGVLALVVALIFGAALGYAVALTVLIEEFALGVVDLIRLLEGDAKAVAHISETLAEREVGQVGQGLLRLVGVPVSPSARASRPTVAPTLPTLPRYPTAPARPQRTASVASAVVEAAASAGAAALARRAAQAPAPPAQQPADEATQTTEPEAPIGEPVRADHLPRIGWTYEHEAIRPTRAVASAIEATPEPQLPADESDTLAELAGVSALADSATSEGASDTPVTAQAEPVGATEPESAPQAEPEPMDVSVVSATALGARGPVAPTLTMDDAPALELEGERLAEPASLAEPDDAEPVAPALDPAMLAPAPATTPLPQDEPPALDPAMLAAAPTTTPLPQDEPPASTSEPPAAEAPAIPVAAAPSPPNPLEAAPLAAEPDSATEPTEPTPDEAPMTETPVRSAFSRVTRPVEGLASGIDAISKSGAPTGARASAPESGLWERLSQALIDRSGAPSSPFAAPQSSRVNPSDGASDGDAIETDETPQA